MQKDMGILSPGPEEHWHNICDILSFIWSQGYLTDKTIFPSFLKKCLVFILYKSLWFQRSTGLLIALSNFSNPIILPG